MRVADAGIRVVTEETRLNSVCPWRIKIARVFLNSLAEARKTRALPVGSGSTDREAPGPRTNALAVVPPAPHVVKIQPRPGARYSRRWQGAEGRWATFSNTSISFYSRWLPVSWCSAYVACLDGGLEMSGGANCLHGARDPRRKRVRP